MIVLMSLSRDSRPRVCRGEVAGKKERTTAEGLRPTTVILIIWQKKKFLVCQGEMIPRDDEKEEKKEADMEAEAEAEA